MTKLVTLVVLACSFSAFAGQSNRATKPLFKDDKELLNGISRFENHESGVSLGQDVFEKAVEITEKSGLKLCREIGGGEGMGFEPELIAEGKVIQRGMGSFLRDQLCVSGLKGGEETQYDIMYDVTTRLELISQKGKRMTEAQKNEKEVAANTLASASEENENEYGLSDAAPEANPKQKELLNKFAESATAVNPYYHFAKYYNNVRQELRAHGYKLCSKRMSRYKTGRDLGTLATLETYQANVRQGKDLKIQKELCFIDPTTKSVRRLEIETKTTMKINITEGY